jgi:hypothetical protein
MVVMVLTMSLAGVDVVPTVVVVGGYALAAIGLMHPRRPWWRLDVQAIIGNKELVLRWGRQDLILVVLLVVGVSVLSGIVMGLAQP